MGIDWKRKLSSRKLWVAIAGLAVGVWLFCQNPTPDNLSAIILMAGSVVAYILAEGWTDASREQSNTTSAEVTGAAAKAIVEGQYGTARQETGAQQD